MTREYGMLAWFFEILQLKRVLNIPSTSHHFLGLSTISEASGGRSRAFRLCPTGAARGASDGRAGGAGGVAWVGTEACLKRVMKLVSWEVEWFYMVL